MSSVEEDIRRLMHKEPFKSPAFIDSFDSSEHSLMALHDFLVGIEAGVYAYFNKSGPTEIEINDEAEFSLELLNPGDAVITADKITPGNYKIEMIRDGSVTTAVASIGATAADGRIYCTYKFAPLASPQDWKPGDLFLITFTGGAAAISGKTTYFPDGHLYGRIVREEEIITEIGSKHTTTQADVASKHTVTRSQIKAEIDSKHTTTDAEIGSKHTTTRTDVASKHTVTRSQIKAEIDSKHTTTDAEIGSKHTTTRTDVASKHTVTRSQIKAEIDSKHTTTDAEIGSKHTTTRTDVASKHTTTQSKITTVYRNVGSKAAGDDILTRLGAFTAIKNLYALLGGFDQINTLWDSLGGYDKDDPLKEDVDFINRTAIPASLLAKTINAYVQAVGSNDANNEFASNLVLPNVDGSALERLEHLKDKVSSLALEFMAQPAQPTTGTLTADPTEVDDSGTSGETAYGAAAVVKSYEITAGLDGVAKYVYADLMWKVANGVNQRSKWMVCAGDTFVFASAVDLTDELAGAGTFHRSGQIKLAAMDNVPFTIALLTIVDSGTADVDVVSTTELRVSMTVV